MTGCHVSGTFLASTRAVRATTVARRSIHPSKEANMKFRKVAVATAGALVVAAAGMAGAKDVAVSLTGDQEVPAVTTAAKGTGKITIADDKSVTGSIKTSG